MGARKGDTDPVVPEVLANADARMGKAVEALRRELASLRTGRATPALVENILVDYYGVPTPLHQMASVSVPEARLILIQPWDRGALPTIERSLLKSELGLNPANDGNVLRVPIPPLSEERRRELVRVLRRKIEEGKVAVRNVRRDALEQLREMERNKVIPQDENRRAQEQLQGLTDAHVASMDELSAAKEAEIMQV